MLYGLVVLLQPRREVVHYNVTAHPTAFWTAQQIIEAFPEETAPRFLLRDRDQIYGGLFRLRVAGMGIEEVVSAAQSPWQNPLCGALHRLSATGVPGPHHCLQRIFLAANSKSLLRVLRALTDTSGA